jgi:hypothetical protein
MPRPANVKRGEYIGRHWSANLALHVRDPTMISRKWISPVQDSPDFWNPLEQRRRRPRFTSIAHVDSVATNDESSEVSSPQSGRSFMGMHREMVPGPTGC